MNLSRRNFLRATAAAGALGALNMWPTRAFAATQPADVLWINKHGNLAERVWRYYDVWNEGLDSPWAEDTWRSGLTRLNEILGEAQTTGRRVRAVGARWSLSPCAVCPDIMINTMPLNFHQVGLAPDDLSTSTFDPKRLVFAQCGAGVAELSETLEARGLSLPTSGASNGQTICGAIGTGTHGSARRVGSMQDYMLGLHLLAEDGRRYWIERETVPVVSSAFCQRLGATLVRDDRAFNAAVVSFGSFGIIHAVLFEAVPAYLLEVHRRRLDWNDVLRAATTLDTDGIGLPYPGIEPFHFDVSVNPYCLKSGDGGAVVTAMYKKAFRQLPRRAITDVAMVPGVDLLAVSGKLAKFMPRTIPMGVNAMFASMMKATDRVPLGTHGQVFAATPMAGQSLSAEIGVDLASSRDAIHVLIDTAKRYPFPGLFGMRYVQRSRALLAFTKFDTTCTIEMTGAGGLRTKMFYERAWAALDAAEIPYTLHWGKINNTSCDNIKARWGSAVGDWTAARRSLLGPVGRSMFANDLLTRCELHN